MRLDDALDWLEASASELEREKLARYGIPDDRALGISIGDLKRFGKEIGKDHELALGLWATGGYEARTLAAFIDDPRRVTESQMDAWCHDFDSWAICDTTCFHLFDRTSFAWAKVEEWHAAPEELVRRAAYALVWGLSVHDKGAADERFLRALEIIESAAPDDRALVKKGIDMALRATGKRNATLNLAAIAVAERLVASDAPSRAWIGRHAHRELTSAKVQKRFEAT